MELKFKNSEEVVLLL